MSCELVRLWFRQEKNNEMGISQLFANNNKTTEENRFALPVRLRIMLLKKVVVVGVS